MKTSFFSVKRMSCDFFKDYFKNELLHCFYDLIALMIYYEIFDFLLSRKLIQESRLGPNSDYSGK